MAKTTGRQKPDQQYASKVDEAYALIEEDIITLVLAPGQLISENELVQKFNLGRTPVREALQRLAAQHLVEIMPRRGIRVSDIDIKTQMRLIEVRKVLEQLQAKLVTQRASEAQRQQFKVIAEGMENAAKQQDYLAFVRLDSDYNQLMAEACDNPFITPMLEQMHGLSRRFWHCHFKKQNDLSETARLHAQVAKAIVKGDVDLAEKSAQEHMQYIHEFTKLTLNN